MLDREHTGAVKLRSGRWRWSAVPTDDGHVLIFRHETRLRDEMKTWVGAEETGGIIEAARHPVYRVWEDQDGVLWIVGVEFASLKKDSDIWLTFRNPFREMAALAPGDVALGDLTDADLARYLQGAS